MTFIVPNYFLEQEPDRVITAEELFTVTYATRKNNDSIAVRNTTHVMILLMKGEKHLRSIKGDFHLKSHDILLLTQGNYFMSEIISKVGVYESIMIYFDDDFIADFVSKYKIDLAGVEGHSIAPFTTNALLQNLTKSLSAYLHEDLDNQSAIIKLKTQEIFLHLLDLDKEAFCGYLKAVISTAKERIKHILEANVDVIESVEDMARIVRVSKQELRGATLEAFGLLPKAWLDSVRLEEAAVLLKSTDRSVSDIATTCGYASTSWFGVQFKKHYGCTPKVYREVSK
jgi:AraC-like DNA-binding protein